MRTVEWQGESGGVEWEMSGSLRQHTGRRIGGFSAFGGQRCADFEVSWQLTASSRWTIDSLDLRVRDVADRGDDRARVDRTLLLERGDDGWRAQAWRRDTADLPDPGLIAGHPEIVDVIVDDCPLTHLPALRRLDLVGYRQTARRGGPVPRSLAGAVPVLRVMLPSLAVLPARHRYHWVSEGVTAGVAEVALRHAFAGAQSTELSVDEYGVPVAFGGLHRRRDSAMVA